MPCGKVAQEGIQSGLARRLAVYAAEAQQAGGRRREASDVGKLTGSMIAPGVHWGAISVLRICPMRDVLFVIGFALFALGILALFVYVMFGHLHKLYLLFTGRVPMYRIARFLIAIVVGFAILSPIVIHMEGKSPLHLAIKPMAEDRVRANESARELIGEPMSFGWERSFSTNGTEQEGFGELSFPVRGGKGNGDVDVTAKETLGVWRVDSTTLVTKDRSLPIPIE
jgi:hypothetical protein